MFGDIANRFVSSIASLTAVVFSSYQGNEARFSEIALHRQTDQVTIQCQLEQAFEHDFDEFFRSAESINVWFMLQVRNGSNVVLENFFVHNVKYDPMTMFYEIYLQDQEYSVTAQSYQQLVDAISRFNRTISLAELDQTLPVQFVVTAYLPTIKLPSMDRPFDLMLLWNFKRPTVRRGMTLDEIET